MRTVVITDAETGGVVACVPEHGAAIIRNDMKLHIYEDTEPIFRDSPYGPVLKENAFIIKLKGEDG